MSQAASEAIKRMPDGPAILYAFGQDPNLVSAMHNMDPVEQMIHLEACPRSYARNPPPDSPMRPQPDALSVPNPVEERPS